ncbi:MAG: ExbD/TolR family protein [Sphingomonadales bacterium]
MRKRVKSGVDEADIDLTPMLDIVFIMLIFFIVTASFVREKGLDVVKPPDTNVKQQKQKSILVRIEESGQIWMGTRIVDARAVRANIERLHAERPEASVVIQAAKKAKSGILVGVMDASRQAGVYNVSLAAQNGQ